MLRTNKVWLILLGMIIFLSSELGCQRKTSSMKPNLPPNTTLANIPQPYDTLFALVTVHWDGEDVDGYILGYKYRYVTHHVFQGDSVVQDWQFTKETHKQISFESTDSLNLQRFEVKAVDNDRAEDPTPAIREFYTIRAYEPKTELLSPTNNDQFFALNQTSDWWQGIQVTFHGTDADGEIVDYGWKVDQGDWMWTSDTSIVIGSEFFAQPLDGFHTIKIMARDNTGLVDPTPDTVRIRLVEPKFDRKILLLDETTEGTGTPGYSSDEQLDEFYSNLFHPDTSWDYFTSNRVPPKEVLGRYRLLIWYADDKTVDHHIRDYQDYIADYLNVGGKLILSGWRVLKSFHENLDFPLEYASGSFIHDYLHVMDAHESPSVPGDFTGAKGLHGYPDVEVDNQKVSSFPYFGMLTNVNRITPGAFSITILTFNSQTTNVQFQDRPVGLRYYGTVFDLIFLGFPLAYLKDEDAQLLAQKMLEDLSP